MSWTLTVVELFSAEMNWMSWLSQPYWNGNSMIPWITPLFIPQSKFLMQHWKRRPYLVEGDLMSYLYNHFISLFHCSKLPVWRRKRYSTDENRVNLPSSMPACCINKNPMKKSNVIKLCVLFPMLVELN